ncbi:DUF2339 domain-containing protein [Blastochloris tepida]|uniref:Membrane protein n=1 Tax=Blastochloris tepida TaxID=2233851 RepID=A0A348FY02_9HYPH|nr:DUF2339 domain-containing protein [Blastochloris tepida]BBF92185.1 membrane protein [Blastochloris tepida]
MDGLWLLALLVGALYLVTPAIAIIALARVNRLSQRVLELEQRLAAGATAAPVLEAPEAAREPMPAEVPQIAAVEAAASEAIPEAEAVAPPPSPPVQPTQPPGQSATSGEVGDIEQAFGTRWVVWTGGLALALGGVFLVRYTIEAGLLGPAARVALGGLFSVLLVAVGERLRRQDRTSGFAGVPAAYVPAMLTAAGTASAYATVWAAYELYGFLPPATAFLLLGIVAVAAIAAALLHGPALAAIGTLAAYATPILTATPDPDAYGLFAFLGGITAAAYAVARVRLWRWLATSATVLVTLWGLSYAADPFGPATGTLALHAILQGALVAALIVPGLWFGPPAAGNRADGLSTAALAALVAILALHAVTASMDTGPLVLLAIAIAVSLAIAWRAEATTLIVPLAAALAVAVTLAWAIEPNLATTVAPAGAAGGPEPLPVLIEPIVAFAAAISLLMLATGVAAIPRRRRGVFALVWAGAAAATPVVMLAACYWRIAEFLASVPFTALALALAALYGSLAERLLRGRRTPGSRACASVFATACLATLALGATMILERGWLTVALALVALAAAHVAASRPYPFLRWVAGAFGALLLGRIAWDPAIMGSDVGATPVFNWLLWGYGVPALAMALGARQLRRQRDDIPARLFESAAILFVCLLVTFEIRHALHAGNIYAARIGLVEAGLQVSAWAVIAATLERMAAATGSRLRAAAAVAITLVALIGAWVMLGITENPLFSGKMIEPRFLLNSLLPGYAAPAVAFLLLHVATRARQPASWRAMLAATAFACGFAYVNLQVALAFRGPFIGLLQSAPISDGEWYAYSAVWLVSGLLLLLIGLLRGSRPARIASAGLITLTVLKVFLSDMADLEGVLRAVSFIGLGVVLVGIGWLYQRLLIPRRAPDRPAEP